MSDVSPSLKETSRGGLGVVLFVFGVLGFGLTIGAHAVLLRPGHQPGQGMPPTSGTFDPSPVANLIVPQPSFSPAEVVRVQLEGLSNADSSAGIQQCFTFASPGNKRSTGPLSRFAVMVSRPPYAVLMRHQLALVGAPAIEGETAAVVVTLLDDHDSIHVFQFMLSRQHGDGVENCWMTDAVYPLRQLHGDPDDQPPTAIVPWFKSRRYTSYQPLRTYPWGEHG